MLDHLRYAGLAVAILFAACSRDPNQQKLSYLKSGDKYVNAAKYQEAAIEFRNALQIDPRFATAHWKLAGAYLKLGNSEAAYRELTETVSLDPKNADAQLELAKMLLARRHYGQAQAAAETALKLRPDDARGHAILGEKYIRTHDRQNAIQELAKAVDADPKRVEGYDALGAAYLAAGETAESLASYRKGIEINPKSVQAHVALGEYWISQGKLVDAEAEMQAAAALDSRAVLPRLVLVRLYQASNRGKDAEELCRELKRVAPDDPLAYQALASFYISSGQKDQAAVELQSLAAAKPNDVAVKHSLVEVLLDLSRTQEARAINQDILRRNPSDAQGLLSHGRMLLAEDKYREAVAVLQSAVKSDPSCARCYYLLGSTQSSLGLPAQAKSSLSRARELAPRVPDPAAALARLELKSGDYDLAQKLASGASRENPDLVAAYVTEARALISKGELRDAEARLDEALKRDDASLPAAATLLSLYMRQGKTQLVLPRIAKMAEQHPENAGLRVLLAVSYFTLKDLDKSESTLRQALTIDPKAKDSYRLLAQIDLARGSVEKAKADLRRAIDADPRNVSNYAALGTQFEKEGNWEEAKKFFEKAHGLDPTAPLVTDELAFLYLEHGGDVNMALSLAQTAKRQLPHSPVTADALGWAYYKIGSTESAVAELKDCVMKEPNNALFQYHLGMAYVATGHLDAARSYLQKALKDFPNFPNAATAKSTLDKISRPVR